MNPLEQGDPPTIKDGQYTVLGILGEGAMGRTYLAENREGLRVAIKTLFPSRLASLKDLELFHREAQVLSKLDHPNIPMYIDSFDSHVNGPQYFLVQQFVEGKTLRTSLSDGDRFDDGSIRDFALKLLKVLVYLQSQDPPVVHRDLKPENIMIAPNGSPHLVDFGAVREVVRLTMGGGSTIIGSYGYMPPEQLMGRAIPSSDLYSLGITLIECLTLQTPNDLSGRDVDRLITSTNVSESTQRFLRRLCAPKVTERYQTAQDAFDDLERLSHGGALIVASDIETSITTQEEAHLAELKKQDRPSWVFLVTIAAGGVGAVAFVGLLVILLSVAQSVNTALLAAGSAMGLGLLMTLTLIGQRITHDAWTPPDDGWRLTRGEVVATTSGAQTRNEMLTISDQTITYAEIRYQFTTASGNVYEGSFAKRGSDISKGATFDVYYRTSNPKIHECADIVSGETELSLFDPKQRY